MKHNDLKDPYDTVNISILKYLTEGEIENPRILDVGCWHGALGKELRKTTPYCIIDGVDNNKNALIQARSNGYCSTHLVDLNFLENIQEISGKYDFIIFGDVLEHTLDPDKILSRFIEYLNAEGCVVVSLPNIGFLLYRITHLFGQWNYRESGVMDKTHLRFFTQKTMEAMFAEHGLVIEQSIGFVGLNNRPGFIRKPLRWLANMYPSMFAMQIIYKLRKMQL